MAVGGVAAAVAAVGIVAALVIQSHDAGSARVDGPVSAFAALHMASAGLENSELFHPVRLADLASTADVFARGRIVSFDEITPLPAGVGVQEDPPTIQVLHATVALDQVYSTTSKIGRVGATVPVIFLAATSEVATSGDGTVPAKFRATLPSGEALFSLVRNDDPALRVAGFFGEYSLTSSAGLVTIDAGAATTPLDAAPVPDWLQAAVPASSASPLGAIAGEAVAGMDACAAISSCLTNRLGSDGFPIRGKP